MYKVFVDHKPIIFLQEADAPPTGLKIRFKDLPLGREELKPFMEKVELDVPLYILCIDPKKAFTKYFKEYKKIKAAGGIVRRKEKYLIIKRNGLWDIPKGRIEKGEDRELAAIREIEEECGILAPTIEAFITRTYHIFKYKGRDAIKTTFWYSLHYDGPKDTFPQRIEGIKKAKWVTYEKLMNLRGNTYGSINQLLDDFESSED
jgi:8-oxo-dGTP pyrophosphatase MutT (NUDIX family)